MTMENKRFIVKMQRAIYPQGDTVLITSQDKRMCQQVPLYNPINMAIGDRLKAYFEVSQREDGVLVLHGEVEAAF